MFTILFLVICLYKEEEFQWRVLVTCALCDSIDVLIGYSLGAKFLVQ